MFDIQLDVSKRFALLQNRVKWLEVFELFYQLVSVRAWFTHLILQSLDTTGDDVEVGDQEVVVEVVQVRLLVAGECSHNDDQAARFSDRCEFLCTAVVISTKAGRVDKFERCDRDLLRVIDAAERIDAIVGYGHHSRLRRVGERGIGFFAGEPVKQRALSGPLIADDTDFHIDSLFLFPMP